MDESHNLVKRMATFAEWWVRRAGRDEKDGKTKTILIAGEVGCGKTHLAENSYRYLTNHAVDLFQPAYWQVCPITFFGRWVSMTNPRRNESWENFLYDIRGSHIVFLDDVGADNEGFKNGENIAKLQEVLDIVKNRWCFITTNIFKKDWREHWGARIDSRLQAATYVDASGIPDYRLKK